MPRRAAISAMATAEASAVRPRACLPAADLLAEGLRSLVFHAGWLVQAQLGMALTWSWAGGLGGVALWWACLLWFERSPGRVPARSLLAAAGAMAAGGLALALTQGQTAWGLLGWGLNLLGWTWLCSRQSAMPGTGRWPGIGPALAGLAGMLLAALLAAGALWPRAWPLVCAALLMLPWLRPLDAAEHPVHALSLPMGLMMGCLLPMAQWCGNLGWSAAESVSLHLAAMALGLHLAAAWRPRGSAQMRGLWLVAALLCAMASPWAILAAAGVVAAASSWTAPDTRSLRPWAGPVVLLWVGQLSPTWGPDALRLAMVGALLMLALTERANAAGRVRI